MDYRWHIPLDMNILSFLFFLWGMSFIFRFALSHDWVQLFGAPFPFIISIYMYFTAPLFRTRYYKEDRQVKEEKEQIEDEYSIR